MQQIAREMAVSETAFVLSPPNPASDLWIRWFTPSNEVPLCGHATIASFHALAEANLRGIEAAGTYTFRLLTKSGILPVVAEKGKKETMVRFGLPLPEFQRAGQHKLDLMHILGVEQEALEQHLPIVEAEYLYVPVRRLHTLFSLKPNLFALSQFLTNRKYGGVCVFTTETVDNNSAVHSRFFAPHQGINEDPVTGSANGPLGVYLFEQGVIEPAGDTLVLIGEQGDVLGRRGRVTIRLGVRDNRAVSVDIEGRAVTVLKGDLVLAPRRSR
jgi:PhzF family phenazine biosynthesis protein